MPTWGPKESLDALGHGPRARAHEPWARARALGLGCAARCVRGGCGLLGAVSLAPGRRPPRAHLAAHPSPRARALAHGSCALALGPCPKGSKDSLGPHVGMYFHKKVWKLYQMYKSRVLLSVARKLFSGFLTFSLQTRCSSVFLSLSYGGDPLIKRSLPYVTQKRRSWRTSNVSICSRSFEYPSPHSYQLMLGSI